MCGVCVCVGGGGGVVGKFLVDGRTYRFVVRKQSNTCVVQCS